MLSSIHPIGHEIGRKMLIRYFPGILCGFTRDADLKKCGFKREMTVVVVIKNMLKRPTSAALLIVNEQIMNWR